jgi:hypothetical protein
MTSTAEPGDGVDGRLRELMARGYRFVHPRDDQGELLAVVGVRSHHRVIDIVQLRDEDDATAMRIPGDEPNIMAPATLLWQTSGPACRVLDDVLALEDTEPAVRGGEAGAAAKGCWVPGPPGRSRWLAATA